VVVDKPDLGQSRIVLAHEGIDRRNPDRVAADIMNQVLGGGGFSSRLMARVRSDEGLTYGVYSGFDLRRQPGPFIVSTFTRVEETGRVVELLLEEMRRIREEPPTDDELAQAISLAVGRFGLGLESSEAVLAGLVNLELYDLPPDSLDTYRTRVRAVDAEAVADAARRFIHPDRVAIVVLGPAEDLVPQLESFGEVEVVQP
jgi:zinc protease